MEEKPAVHDRILHRRDFLAGSLATFLAMHLDGLRSPASGAASAAPSRKPRFPGRGPRLRRIRMQTHRLGALRGFYRDLIGFPLVAETGESVAVAAGATRLEFVQVRDGSEPYYHFAFNIPENKLLAAKTWLGQRVPILRHEKTGEEVIHFKEWNAHSLFFYDPSGNLVELIARHTLDNAAGGEFSVEDILYASEIGLVPPEQGPVFAAIRDGLKIEPYLNSSSFLGDEYGIIIVIPKDRLWIPEFKKAGMLCPTWVTVAGHGDRQVRFKDLPFEIVSA